MNERLPYLGVLLVWFLLAFLRQAGGRLAPRMALAPLLFLVSRWPVLVGWGIGAAGMATLLVPGALARGRDSLPDILVLTGLSAFCGLGFAALAVGPLFVLARAFAPKPVLPLEPGERVLHEFAANHFLGGESRGGKLVVTDRRLAFRPHRFNVQLDTWSVPLDEILGFDIEGDRMLLVHTTGAPEPAWLVSSGPRSLAELLMDLVKRDAPQGREAEPPHAASV